MAQIFSPLAPERARALLEDQYDGAAEPGALPRWLATPLTGDRHPLDEARGVVLLRFVDPAGADAWLAMQPPDGPLQVNGVPVRAGLRVLADRDELRLGAGGASFHFSTEAPPRVTPFPADPAAEISPCPRCRQPNEPEQPSVRCPSCGVWYHEAADRGCWTYAPDCALCRQPTALDAELRWVPGEGARAR